MFNKKLNQVQNVIAGQMASLRISPEDFTLVKIKLALSGTTFDKTKIDRVVVKIGAKTIWDVTGAQLNKYNNYKNQADNAKYLTLDFTERDQSIFPVKQVGGLDLMSLLPVGEVYVHIYINATAVAPKIDAVGYFERTQDNPFVTKMLPYSFTQSASGRFTLPLQFRGALLKRVWLFYNGPDWTGSTNGNIESVEVKKNSLVIHDQTCLDVRFDQAEYKKVPQSGLYVVDFIIDNNHDAHVQTIRNTKDGQIFDSFEFNAMLKDAGGATVSAIVEVLDTPTNL